MTEAIMSFSRTEQKYLISDGAKARILEDISRNITPDPYGESTVYSLYLDTPKHRMIRESVDARAHGSAYRVKLRLRCYGKPASGDRVYIELKQKYLKTVYKRRIGTSLDEAYRYFADGSLPEHSQIMNEIEYIMRHYERPRPSMLICCEREGFFAAEDSSLRITFDKDVRYRTEDIAPENGSEGKPLLDRGSSLMEIKASLAVPRWLSDSLSRERVYPISFSKYAAAYADSLRCGGKEKVYGELFE